MRRFVIIMLLLLGLSHIIQAQQSTFECETEETYTAQMTLLPPVIDEEALTQFVVTVLGVDDFIPILGITEPDTTTFCNSASDDAALYNAALPIIGTIPPSANNAQEFVSAPGQNVVRVGSVDKQPGAFLLLIESEFDPTVETSHTFTLPFDANLMGGPVQPTAYLFSLTLDFAPTLTIPVAEGDPIVGVEVAEPITLETELGVFETALGAGLPVASSDVQITVDSNNSEGRYLLALYFKTGEARPGDGIAQVTENEDGSLTLTCNDEILSENAVRFVLPDDGETYTVTVVGLPMNNPVLALVDDSGAGFCFDDTDAASGYAALLPTIELESSPFSAQVVIDGAMRTLVAANQDASNGDFMILVEGGQITAGDSGDIFGVQLTQGMVDFGDVLNVYAIASDDMLNAALAYINAEGSVITDEDGLPIECDDAGVPDACYGDVPILSDYDITLADGLRLPTLELDTLLAVPIDETLVGSVLSLRVTGSNDTSGSYIVIFDIVTQ